MREPEIKLPEIVIDEKAKPFFVGEVLEIRGHRFKIYGLRENGRLFLKQQRDTSRTYVKEKK